MAWWRDVVSLSRVSAIFGAIFDLYPFSLFVGHVFAIALTFFYVNSCVVVVLFIKLA
jgi:hypothetical protein